MVPIFATILGFLALLVVLGSFASGEEDSWSQIEEDFSSEHHIGRVDVQLDSQNSIHYFWEQSLHKGPNAELSLERELFYQKLSADGKVEVVETSIATTRIENPDDSSYPCLLIDSRDTPHFIWKEAGEKNHSLLRYTHYDENGEKYFSPLSFVSEESLVATMPTVGIDDRDRVHIAWFDIRYDSYNKSKILGELWYTLLYGEFTQEDRRPGHQVSAQELTLIDDTRITEACRPVKAVELEEVLGELLADPPLNSAELATDTKGQAHLVWSDGRDGNAEIYYACLDPDRDDQSGDSALRNQIKVVEDRRLSYSSDASHSPAINVAGQALGVIFLENDSAPSQHWKLQYYQLSEGHLAAAKTIYESSYPLSSPRLTGSDEETGHLAWLVHGPQEDTLTYRKLRLSDWKTELEMTMVQGKEVSRLALDTDVNDNINLAWNHNLFLTESNLGKILRRYYNARPDFSISSGSSVVLNSYSSQDFLAGYLAARETGDYLEDTSGRYVKDLRENYHDGMNMEFSVALKNKGRQAASTRYVSFFSSEALDPDQLQDLKDVFLESPDNYPKAEDLDLEQLERLLEKARVDSLLLNLETGTGVVNLEAEQEKTLRQEFSLPVGEYYFYTLIDPFNIVFEERETNNLVVHDFRVFNTYPSTLYFNSLDRDESGLPGNYRFSFCLNVIEPREWLYKHSLEGQGNDPDPALFSVDAGLLVNGEEFARESFVIKEEDSVVYIIGDQQTELLKQYVSLDIDAEDFLAKLQKMNSGEEDDLELHVAVVLDNVQYESAAWDNFAAKTLQIPLYNDLAIEELLVMNEDEMGDTGGWPGSEDQKLQEQRIIPGTQGERFFISTLLGNRGDLPLIGELNFYLDERTPEQFIGSRTVVLQPESSQNVTISFKPELGTHTLIVVADERDIIIENNEENNLRTVIFRIVPEEKDPGVVDFAPTVVLVGGVALLGLAGAFVSSQYGKYTLFSLVIVPLYTRLKKEEVLDQFLRGEIFGYIKAHPGAHYNQIKRDLDLNNGNLSYHLKVLERERFIKSEQDGINRRFYPWGMKVKDQFHLSDVQNIIRELIVDNPGASQKEIAKMAGLSTQVVNYHIRILTQASILRLGKRGRKTLCYVNE